MQKNENVQAGNKILKMPSCQNICNAEYKIVMEIHSHSLRKVAWVVRVKTTGRAAVTETAHRSFPSPAGSVLHCNEATLSVVPCFAAITGTDETFAYFAIFLLLISVQRSDVCARTSKFSS